MAFFGMSCILYQLLTRNRRGWYKNRVQGFFYGKSSDVAEFKILPRPLVSKIFEIIKFKLYSVT
jgi:hypothetical protein